MKKVFIVIAAYNEGKSIEKVIKSLKSFNYKNVVVVDDGSADNTVSIAQKQGVFVLRHALNRGQGASLKTGIDFALLKGADFIVTFDADGQHNPSEIKNLLKPVESGICQVTLGSRFLKSDSNTPAIRKFVLKSGALFVWFFYGIKLTDSHNGFRVFSRKAAMAINITSDRMEHASQIVEEIHKLNLSFREVPVTITYSNYSKGKGQSSVNSLRIAFKMLFRKLMH